MIKLAGEKIKKKYKKLRRFYTLLLVKVFRCETTSFHHFSPKDSETKFFWTSDMRHECTNRLIKSIGPEGRCFEKKLVWSFFQSNYTYKVPPWVSFLPRMLKMFLEMLCQKPNLASLLCICLVTELWDFLSCNPLCSLHHHIEVTKKALFQEVLPLKGNKQKQLMKLT